LAALRTLAGWLAILFHFLFCLAIAALGAFSLAAGAWQLHPDMLPWSGGSLADILLLGGLFGLFSLTLAAWGKLRFLFFLWSLAAAVMLSKALIFSGYRFASGEWRSAAYLVAAAWFATVGAFFHMRALPASGKRRVN
jgi:hypothetical protein